jgi:hypothetical protein
LGQRNAEDQQEAQGESGYRISVCHFFPFNIYNLDGKESMILGPKQPAYGKPGAPQCPLIFPIRKL